MKFNEKVLETKDYLLSQIDQCPSIGLVLGSGLGILADEIENPVYIPYNKIPHFPTSTVTGHAGRMVIVISTSSLKAAQSPNEDILSVPRALA